MTSIKEVEIILGLRVPDKATEDQPESVRDKLWLWIDQAGRDSHVHIPTEDIRRAINALSALMAEVSKLKDEAK